MATMVVAKPFVLRRNNGDLVPYGFGVHEDVPTEDAEHPYAQHFLAVNGKLPAPAIATPPTHEERVAMKAALDDADARIRAAESESKAAREAHDALKLEHEQAKSDLAVSQGRVSSLEADLDKATKPPAAPTPAPVVIKPVGK